ncbi:MAG: PQQ-dependent sugar dehydrogenase [Isosphaeraceae bacterium]
MTSIRCLAALLGLFGTVALAGDEPVALPGERLRWDDSRLVGTPDPPTPYRTTRSFPKIYVFQPLALLPEPGTDRLFALQHLGSWSGPGRLVSFRDDPDADRITTLLEKIDGIAYGIAFHPDYRRTGWLFIGLNAAGDDGKNATKVVRYTVDRADPDRIDPGTATTIISWPSDGHNGGDLAFGPDGFLYVSSGDGTSDSDLNLTGQTLDDLLAAVLRIDVDRPEGGKPYGVPKDNPFLDRPRARPEIWAYGFRNPWRLSYDHELDQLWVGNNGQDLWEQVYLVRKGANYGWSVSEGSHIFHAKRQAGPDPISPPAAEHHHSEARSLTGGRVYQGKRLPELRGTYVYGDWSTGRAWGIKADGGKVTAPRLLVDTPFNVTGFGTDHAGELYIFDQAGGTFQQLEPTGPEDLPPHPFPKTLGETGLFRDVARHETHPALIPYEINAPAWTDGATARRFVAIPGLGKIERKPQLNAGGGWTYPNGSVLMQTLTLDCAEAGGKVAPRRVETRVLIRQQGEWSGYSYRWNDAQTDAELVADSGDEHSLEVPDQGQAGGTREQIWRFPSRAECMVCHSRAAGFTLGLNDPQLSRDVRKGSGVIHQLRGWEALGLFDEKLPPTIEQTPRLPNPYGSEGSLEERVKSYLHVNCATCHVEAGGGNARMQLDFHTPADRMRLIDAEPIHDRFDIADARLVAPGSMDRSVLYRRLTRRGTGQMPPLVSTEVDAKAARLIADWIGQLPPSKP